MLLPVPPPMRFEALADKHEMYVDCPELVYNKTLVNFLLYLAWVPCRITAPLTGLTLIQHGKVDGCAALGIKYEQHHKQHNSI